MIKLISGFLFVSFSVLSFEQVSAQKIDVGVIGGLSVPQLKSTGDNIISQDYKSRLGATYGVFADFGVIKNFSIKVVAAYASQGGKRNGSQPLTSLPPELLQLIPPGTQLYANFDNEAILNYLEIPVMAKLEWGGKLKYYANLGPYIGILLSAKQITEGSSQLYFDKAGTKPLSFMGQPLPGISFNATTNVKNDINSINVGITGGGGLTYPLSKAIKVLLDVRGAYGFTNIQEDTQANGESKTGGVFITTGLAYSFHHKK
ncbi:MAG: porin family protein [Ferruginibacter sp.]